MNEIMKIKTQKNQLITPKIAIQYMVWLDDLSDDEFYLVVSLLLPLENNRFSRYEESLWKNFTRKRAFLFICNLIDFYEYSEEKKLLQTKQKVKKNKYKNKYR
jgi:hypothetical protein